MKMRRSQRRRFWARIDRSAGPDECWGWKGAKRKNGVGRVKVEGKEVKAHTVVYNIVKGRIPDGEIVRHTCKSKGCCNPRHLYVEGLDEVKKRKNHPPIVIPKKRIDDEGVVIEVEKDPLEDLDKDITGLFGGTYDQKNDKDLEEWEQVEEEEVKEEGETSLDFFTNLEEDFFDEESELTELDRQMQALAHEKEQGAPVKQQKVSVRVFADKKLQGYAMVFPDAVSVLKHAEHGAEVRKYPLVTPKAMTYSGWENIYKALATPDEEQVKRVNDLIEEIKQAVKPPTSRNRKNRWSDNQGEVEVDRVMRGDLEYMRDIRREKSHGPTGVVLLCNLDGGAVFWRGAAAIAAADILEKEGYGCEIWVWCTGRSVFTNSYETGDNGERIKMHRQFTTYPVKEMGQAVDVGAMVNVLSDWFLYVALFGSFAGCEIGDPNRVSIGGMHYHLGEWIKYMDITTGLKQFHVPLIYGREKAIAAVKKVVEQVESDTDPEGLESEE